jgi:hypothetical protein
MLTRNLRHCAEALAQYKDLFEVVIGDNAADESVKELAQSFARSTGIITRYLGAPITRGLVENHIRLLDAARGEWVQFVHDDDFLLPEAGRSLAKVIHTYKSSNGPLKNRIAIVNDQGRILRYEGSASPQSWTPRDAIGQLISESSFIRFPSILIPRTQLLSLGGFDLSQGYVFDMVTWLRMTRTYGLQETGESVIGYTLHPDAGTNSMFTPEHLERIETHLLAFGQEAGFAGGDLQRRIGRSLWRYGLAGCIRCIKWRQPHLLAGRVKSLRESKTKNYPCPLLWLPLKFGFGILGPVSARIWPNQQDLPRDR